jgi:hypothetical protein
VNVKEQRELFERTQNAASAIVAACGIDSFTPGEHMAVMWCARVAAGRSKETAVQVWTENGRLLCIQVCDQ